MASDNAGTISYDPSSKILTLDNVKVNSEGEMQVLVNNHRCEKLIILIKGECRINGGGMTGFLVCDKSTMIAGEGVSKSKLIDNQGVFAVFNKNAVTLIFKDLELSLHLQDKTFMQMNKDDEPNAMVLFSHIAGLIENDAQRAVTNCSALHLEGCDLSNDTHWSASGHAVVDSNGQKASRVEIKLGEAPTSIEEIIHQESSIEAIYNLEGVRLETMQEGVNIVRLSNGTYRKLLLNNSAIATLKDR